MPIQHRTLANSREMHGPHRWVVPDLAARNTLTVTVEDIGKYCLQLDARLEWILMSVTPVSWEKRGPTEVDEIPDAGVVGREILKAGSSSAAKTALGLENVNNTSDVNKPVSTAQAAADSAVAAAAASALLAYQQSLNQVENKSSATIRSEITSGNVTSALGYTPLSPSTVNQIGGIAGLDGTGKIGAAQLPSYVDDVLEYANFSSLPVTGESGKIYILVSPHTSGGVTSSQFRWSGSAYVPIISSPGSTDAVTEGSVNLYFSSARVLSTTLSGLSLITSTDVISSDSILVAVGKLQARTSLLAPLNSPTFTGIVSGITKSMVGLGNVDNTSDVNKPVSTAQASADSAVAAAAASALSAYQLSLNQVENKSSATIRGELTSGNVTSALGYVPINPSVINQIGGVAGLDGTGKVAAAQLPSYVDDVLEYANFAALPLTGESGKIYVLITPYTSSGVTSSQFRWSGSAYVPIVSSPGTTDAVTEGSVNLYFTGARVLTTVLTGLSLATSTAVTAADTLLSGVGKLQAQVSLRAPLASPTFTGTVSGITKSMVGLGNADNTSDADKPVSTAQQTALNLKANLASPTFTGTVTAPAFTGALNGTVGATTPAAGNFTTLGASGNATLTSTTASTSTTTGALVISGGLGVAGNAFIGNRLTASGAAGTERATYFNTGSLSRFAAVVTATAESGSNAGSDFGIARFNDAGEYINIPLFITRSTGAIGLTGAVGVVGSLDVVGAGAVTTSGSIGTLVLTDTGANGVNLRLVGNGGVSPNKTIRAINGSLEVVNSAYSAVIASLNDTGTLTLAGQLAATRGVFSSTTASTSTTTGAVTIAGGLGVSGSGYFGISAYVGAGINWISGGHYLYEASADSVALRLRNDANQVFMGFSRLANDVTSVDSFSGQLVLRAGTTEALRVNATQTRIQKEVVVVGVAEALGAGVTLLGNGATTPNKFIRAINGSLEVVNSAYTAVIASLSDAGAFRTTGVASLNGAALGAPLRVLVESDRMMQMAGVSGTLYIQSVNAAAAVLGPMLLQCSRIELNVNGIASIVADSSGNVALAGQLIARDAFILGGNSPTIEIGAVGTANNPYIDFHSSASVTDFDFRIQAFGGTTSAGQGYLVFTGTNGFIVEGPIRAGVIGSQGYVNLVGGGSAGRTGFIEFQLAAGRRGYVGFNDGSEGIRYDTDGYGVHTFLQPLSISVASGDNAVFVSRPAGSNGAYYIQTSFLNRWGIVGNATAESGSNVGTDLTFAAFADDGSFLAVHASIIRSNGDFFVKRMLPSADNTYTLGASSNRWSESHVVTSNASSHRSNAAPNASWHLGANFSTGSGARIVMENDATYDLAPGSGELSVWDDEANGAADFRLYAGEVTILSQTSSNLFTNTEGTASKINVYFNGTTAYRIQNKSGGTRPLCITLFIKRSVN